MATTTEQDAERRIQEAGRRLIDREVVYCISSLVYTLAQAYGQSASGGDAAELSEQAFELSTAVPDYESAAEEEGWTYREVDGVGEWHHAENDETADDAEDACRTSRIDAHEREVYEHWIVSRWLADKLEKRGEKIDRDFAGMTVWARTTTGQAILLDGVIREIVRELGWNKESAA